MKFDVSVNGQSRSLEVEPRSSLLWVLRDALRLRGTRLGCGMGQCGACIVHLDGRPARSCVVPISAVGSREVTTIEGLRGPVADALRAAWLAKAVPQCGYCQGGQLMSAEALLRSEPRAGLQTISETMAGNLCRCGTYQRIKTAIVSARHRLDSSPPSAKEEGTE